MKKPIQLSITTPCYENWTNMTPVEKGRFCASCQKNVLDFTDSSDREIVDALKDAGEMCGRFRASQLNRDLVGRKEKSSSWAIASAAGIALLSVGVNTASGQTLITTQQHETTADDVNTDTWSEKPKTITGTVKDNTGMPLPGVNVKAAGTSIMVQTDFDGLFFIEVSEGDIVEFTYIGMVVQVVKVSQAVQYDVILQDDYENIEEIFVGSISSGGSSHIGVASQFMFGY